MAGIGDAVDREVAWLRSSGDGLPALLKADGGPFQVIQARNARTPQTRQSGLYLTPARVNDARWGNARKLATFSFRASLWWPVGVTTVGVGIAEVEQQALDEAIGLLIDRVRGLMGDHSHGGRFLAVAEAPASTEIDVQYTDPEQTLSDGVLRAQVLYQAQDQSFI